MKTKNIFFLLILVLFLGCKSTKEVKNNMLDVVSVKSESIANVIDLQEINLQLSEIIIKAADAKKPIIVIDTKGNKRTFENSKSVRLITKKEIKKITKEAKKKDVNEKVVDKSIIKEEAKSVSDAVQYKWIFICIAIIALVFLIIYFKSKLSF